MEQRKPEAVWLRTDMALELVEPYRLDDVLSTLKDNGIIAAFAIGEGFVKIDPVPGQRFDLAMYFAEETVSADPGDHGRKRPMPTTSLGKKGWGQGP